MVISVFAVSIVAVKPMSPPSASVLFSVRIAARSPFSSAVPAASLRTASEKVSVMFPVASVSVAPAAGLNVTVGAVVSTVNVALAAAPWLPSAS